MEGSSWLALALLVAAAAAAAATWPAAGQNPAVCMRTYLSTLRRLAPCRSAVAIYRPTLPSEACCNAVRQVGQPCLCRIVNGPPISAMDPALATQLPVKCIADFEPCDTGR